MAATHLKLLLSPTPPAEGVAVVVVVLLGSKTSVQI